MHQLNYHHLHYFRAVAKEGNLTRARVLAADPGLMERRAAFAAVPAKLPTPAVPLEALLFHAPPWPTQTVSTSPAVTGSVPLT